MLMGFLIILGAVVAFFSLMCRLIEGRWPNWVVLYILGWWWPFRREDAATLAALTFETCPQDWQCGNYSHDHLRNDRLGVKLSDEAKFSVDGTEFKTGLWGTYRLLQGRRRWLRGDRLASTEAMNKRVAEAIIARLG